MNFTVEAPNGVEYKIDESRVGDIVTATFSVMQEKKVPEKIKISFSVSLPDAYSTWSPAIQSGRGIAPNWKKQKTTSRLGVWLPIHQINSQSGENLACISVSDPNVPLVIMTGICEENAEIYADIELFGEPVAPFESYSFEIRIDFRRIPFYDAIYDATSYIEKASGTGSCYIPESATLPMDSLWYSFHQNLDVEEILTECREAKKYGLETVIIDDGWQTEDSSRSYSFCGDWMPATSKVGDMKELVDKIHKIGMKVILWFSVPFVGIKSKSYPEFKDMLLDGTGDCKTFFSLDPRYKKVRDYLESIFANAVDKWNLDGVKLDFIDSFYLYGKSLEPDERRDFDSLEEAVYALLSGIKKSVLKLNPEIMVEFRQIYIGPTLRKIGNMLRVSDCPADPIRNRAGIIDLRLTSGKTPVHSDMLMWDVTSPAESAAKQLATVLFSVPQISVKLEKLPTDHAKMLSFYLGFWRKYRNVLLNGKLKATHPESEYGMARSCVNGTEVIVTYFDRFIEIDALHTAFVNASGDEEFVLGLNESACVKIVDCFGDCVSDFDLERGISKITVPMAGIAFIDLKTE